MTLHADGSSVTIADDARGMPVDIHPKTRQSALEVIFTVLHAGGKFEHGTYKTAGGLHGVGASVVNALSKELVATVKRDGFLWEQRFRQGKPLGPVKKLGAARGTGASHFLLFRQKKVTQEKATPTSPNSRKSSLPGGRQRTRPAFAGLI